MALKKVATNEEIKAPIDCAYAGCQRNAVTHVLTKTGWANMCRHHYDAYHLQEARAYSAGLGLKTLFELRLYCKNAPQKIMKGGMHGEFKKQFEANRPERLRVRERVPGEDDEPITEATA